jgi:hypothetical protein
MIIVAGQILVEPERREAYLQGCIEVIEQARSAPGCLDFALTADLVTAVVSTCSSAGNRQRRFGPSAATVPAKSSSPGGAAGAATKPQRVELGCIANDVMITLLGRCRLSPEPKLSKTRGVS